MLYVKHLQNVIDIVDLPNIFLDCERFDYGSLTILVV